MTTQVKKVLAVREDFLRGTLDKVFQTRGGVPTEVTPTHLIWAVRNNDELKELPVDCSYASIVYTGVEGNKEFYNYYFDANSTLEPTSVSNPNPVNLNLPSDINSVVLPVDRVEADPGRWILSPGGRVDVQSLVQEAEFVAAVKAEICNAFGIIFVHDPETDDLTINPDLYCGS